MSALVKARLLAEALHYGQADVGGAPYFDHPYRVSLSITGDDENEMIAALLHDVLEDCPGVTAEFLLLQGIPANAVRLVQLLTKEPGADYEVYLRCVFQSDAARVKLADIADNMDEARLALLPPAKAEQLRARYSRALEIAKEYGL